MKLKELEAHLQEVTPFREPNVMLEQYPTVSTAYPAALRLPAAHEGRRGELTRVGAGGCRARTLLRECCSRWRASMATWRTRWWVACTDILVPALPSRHFQNCCQNCCQVLDLGCGCGILGIAAGILGAGATLGVEVRQPHFFLHLRPTPTKTRAECFWVQLDPAAMQQAIENAQQMEVGANRAPPHCWHWVLPQVPCPSSLHSFRFDWRWRSQVDLELQHANVADMLAASSAGGTAGRSKPPQLVDTVVMNPPFGTRCAGIDMQVLLVHELGSHWVLCAV